MKYREERREADRYKALYLEGIEKLLDSLSESSRKKRSKYAKDIMSNKEQYREDFARMLGWPLNEKRPKELPEVVEEKLSDEGEYSIYRLQFTVLQEITVSGLLFRYKEDVVRPFVLVQHGKLGTPELISGVYEKTDNYNDMLQRILVKGVNVFAPQLLLWSTEHDEPTYDRQLMDARLKRVGSSVTAVEIYSIMRILDYFAVQTWVGNMGMVGMSYGGFYTLFTAALDIRIKAALSCSYFCDSEHYVQSDWCWNHMDTLFGEAEIACLIHPRKLFLEMGRDDPLFDYRKSLSEYERLKGICGDKDCTWVDLILFDGKHEFYKEDCHIDQLVKCLRD